MYQRRFISKKVWWLINGLLISFLLLSCSRTEETTSSDFVESFQEYLDAQVEMISDCEIRECLDDLWIPIIKRDSIQELIYWNDASLSLSIDSLRDQFIDLGDNDYVSFHGKDGLQAYIPIRYADYNKQCKFLCDKIGGRYQFVTYDIKQSDEASGLNAASWIESIEFKTALSGGYVVLYFLIIISFLLFILKFSNRLLESFGDLLGSITMILALTSVRLIFGLPFFTKAISHHEIFKHQLNTSILSPNLGELFLNMLLFFVITIFLLQSFDNRPVRKYEKFTRWYLLISGYLLVMISIISFVYVVKRVVIHTSISFQFDKIYALDWNTHIFILSILLFICSLFFLSYLLIKILRSTGASLGERLIAFFLATLITFPIFLNFSLHISAFGFYILVLSILILMDLFVETRQKSISWLVIWLVTIASGTTALLYSHNSVSFFIKGTRLAENIGESYNSGNLLSNHDIANPEQFQWAVYDGYELFRQSGNPPADLMTSENIPGVGKSRDFNQHKQRSLIFRHSPGVTIILNKPQNIVIQFISLFSFLFTSLTLVIILVFLLNIFLQFLPSSWNLQIEKGKSIRRKIQYVIFSMLILSFATVFAVTSFYLRDLRTANTSDKTKEHLLGLQFFSQHLKSLTTDQFNSNLVANWDQFNIQFDLYTDSGQRLTNSSLLGLQRPPYDITGKSGEKFQTNLVSHSSDKWYTNFKRLKIDGTPYIISATQSTNSYDENYFVNNLLGTLLNLYIFLFVIASSIALTFSDSITRPLLKLREKFSSVKIGHSNERIDWQSDDELGQLIDDYNRMLGKIEESVSTLAMTERELAWREMAKQVAHEIKNPLTPMKLSLQHLQLAIKRDPERAQELIERVGKTLLEQIDNLSRIASEFSNFAKMPKPENKQVILNEVASSVHDLFRKREDMDINLYIPIDEIYVFGDKHYMTRVLINLLKNAIQAIPTDRRGQIQIHVYKEEENAVIKVMDNGTGIPEEIRDKVFQPNFTSKNSGTGLGLAICANIIESFNGKIFFQTEVGSGTTFFIEIPLMHMADNFKKEKHVIL